MTRTLARHAAPAPRLRITDSGDGVALAVKLLPFLFVGLLLSYRRFSQLHGVALWITDALDVSGTLALAAFDAAAALNWRMWGRWVMQLDEELRRG